MKSWVCTFSLVLGFLRVAVLSANAQVNVTQEHNNLSRNGVYIDAACTPAAAADLKRDLNFDGTISGNVYAQPLYIEGGPNGPMIIAVTESNNVYALNATTGTVIWHRNLGPAVTTGLSCGNINPTGITGTPVVDLNSRRLFFDALIDGPTIKHFIYSLNVDTGTTNSGWPVDLNATATYNGLTFSSVVQEERGAVALVKGIVYVAYSGYAGDCGMYRGWVVGVPINSPSNVHAWAPTAIGGGIWGHGGVASDGTNMFVVTGNTFNTGGNWMGGEAIIRLQAGPTWSGQPTDYWTPTNWFTLLDAQDLDLGGVSATVIDVPGATPSQLVLALGKDGNAYLVNRNNLGGITSAVASANVNPGPMKGTSAVTYHTSQGTYFAFHNDGSAISAFKVTATNPPSIVSAWGASQSGRGSPWVTTTDGTNNMIVWVVGTAFGDQRLHGYNADTGEVIYSGGGDNELMSGTRQFNTGIVARGRIYFAADNKVYAFKLPTGTPTPTPASTPTPTATATITATPSSVATEIWYMNNNIHIAGNHGPDLPAGWNIAGVADFNSDGYSDYLLENASTGATRIWYLHNNDRIGTAPGPSVPGGWTVVEVADFNRDGRPDYLLFNPNTGATVIWYMNNNVRVAANSGPSLPSGWTLTGLADFNGDGYPDYLLYNASTGATRIWYLRNNIRIGTASGPTIPAGWTLVGTADFDQDRHPDYLLSNPTTHATVIWYMSNNIRVGGARGPTLPAGWEFVATADFNGDGKADYLLDKAITP